LPFYKKITNLEGFYNADGFKTLVKPASEPASKGKEELTAQAVGNALYGLQSMSSDVRKVKGLLAGWCPRSRAHTVR
jgi:hypothetical protein